MKQTSLVVAALLAGFLGGVFGAVVIRTRQESQPQELVRARTFELIDEAGLTVSYWGIDKQQNAVLAFGSHWPKRAGESHPVLRLDDPDSQRVAIGVIDDLPFLHLKGADGKTRVRLYLSGYGKPFLLMEDETGPRVLLGVQQSDTPGPKDNDWVLDFGPDRARIGMYAERVGGQTYVRGGFTVHRDKVKYPYDQPK